MNHVPYFSPPLLMLKNKVHFVSNPRNTSILVLMQHLFLLLGPVLAHHTAKQQLIIILLQVFIAKKGTRRTQTELQNLETSKFQWH